MPTASVIIPTLGRSESLRDCLESLWHQSNQDFEIITVREEGALATLRNEGARRAKGRIICFIDDDVICEPQWIDSIIKVFERDESIGGVSGPSYTTSTFRKNRDVFRLQFIHKWMGHKWPGYFSKFGAISLAATKESCEYEGEVEYLEACNMSFRKDVFEKFKGFDEVYKGVGEWCEPDLSFKIRRVGYKLWFSRDARLEHRPSREGAFKKRAKESPSRMSNYELFSSRWIKPCWQHSFYKQLMRWYYVYKTLKR